jgi:hypothetical protein
VFGLTLHGLLRGGRKAGRGQRKSLDVVASWLGGARLNEAPEGQLAKRRHYRWTWKKRLIVRADSERFRARAFDLSEAGAGLFMPQRLKVGSIIWINSVDGTAWISARVVHVDGPNERGLFRTGVEFLSPESEEKPRGTAPTTPRPEP